MSNSILSNSKAEVLKELFQLGFPVPPVYFFSTKSWQQNADPIIEQIQAQFGKNLKIAVRSSSFSEDTANTSMAGAFHSILNVSAGSRPELTEAIEKVIHSYNSEEDNQVLIQTMVLNVAMSGVIMTKVLDDGSPYYLVNFDDSTGRTDTVTGGMSINKTVYIYNGVTESDFDSPFLLSVLKLVWRLEKLFPDVPLDIEFAVDKNEQVYLLQVRRITTVKKWKNLANSLVSERIQYLADYVGKVLGPRKALYGRKSLLGIMPDWNPAEMIGVVPYPLALSLYRELITKQTWRLAREAMGYRKMPNVELMISLYGRCFIDVRNSMNSLLPFGLSEETSEKALNCYLQHLEQHPQLHDKIEFEVLFTAYDFQFEENFQRLYPNVLSSEELLEYKNLLKKLSIAAVENTASNTLNVALQKIDQLKIAQQGFNRKEHWNPFSIADYINTLLNECMEMGTIPFAIIARHGFIAESLLRSAIKSEAISRERVDEFRRSVKTIAGEMGEEFYQVCQGQIKKDVFLEKYGHLRPSTYDILSPSYNYRQDLFDGNPAEPPRQHDFILTIEEMQALNSLLAEHKFGSINAEDLLKYAEKAIVGREYAKFIFTKHVSEIIEAVAQWGELQGFSRNQMALLNIGEILSVLFEPFTKEMKNHYLKKIEKAQIEHDVSASFKLSYLIRSTRDIFVVPQQRSTPNFIGNKRIEKNVIELSPYLKDVPNLDGLIVCIEGADPGYDWIFSRKIAGLITKYGGANSHMAIRCAEYGLPAAIGCGEQPFERVVAAGKCLLDCLGKRLEPISLGNE